VNILKAWMMLKLYYDNIILKLIFFISILISGYCYSQNVVINEVMSSNSATIADEDGEFPDWIEIYNSDSSAINLNGYFLSDDSSDVFKWRIPDITLDQNAFLLLYASGKDRKIWANHWETIINWGNTWKYMPGTAEPPPDWNQVVFDDSLWLSGPSGFGYGDGDDSTTISPTISLYIRKSFFVSDLNNINLAQFHVDYDDAFVAYLNGVEFARRNVGIPGVRPTFNQLADELHEAMIYQGGLPEVILIDNIQSLLQTGTNVLAVQVHNYTSNSSDMTLIPFFTLGMHIPPVAPNGMPDLIDFSIPRLHTNFMIKASGENLYLNDSLGQVVDFLNATVIPPEISFGRQPDGTSNWFFFNEATPESSNTTQGYAGLVPQPQFSLPGGFYSGSVTISLSDSLPGSEIRYTTNGSEPTDTSALYVINLTFTQTTVLRARAFSTNLIPSKVITHTYFIDENVHLPVISLSTDPANLWDYNTGIYVMGPNADPNFPHFGANFWQDWEKPVHLEFYETDGTKGFSLDAGVKIFGGWTRGLPQKSLAIFARGRYGNNKINYQIFPDKSITDFKSIVLRNSGNDWESTMFRDALMTGLVKDADIDIQAYRPSIVFLNGEFWGIHNVREKISEHYIASNHGVDPDNLDFLESNSQIILGDANHYEMLLDFLSTHNISDPVNYEYINTQMNIENFIRYQVSQIYFDNTDWPGNNIKYWRPRLQNGRWRWIMYDTDFGFGLYNTMGYSNNTLAFATAPNGPPWPNPPWSTFMLRKLLENSNFTIDFINRFADFLNYYFEPLRVIQKIGNIYSLIEPDYPAHIGKWGGNINSWNVNVHNLRVFAAHRPNYTRNHIESKFNLTGNYQLTLNINQADQGKIKINSLLISDSTWTGIYFNNVPISLTALPENGYKFKTWTGSITSDSASITISPQNDIEITAVFEFDSLAFGPIVINEINYNSHASFDPGDWVEFVNITQSPIDMSGWQFKDSDSTHVFIFPQNTTIEPDSFIVICRNSAKFFTVFPSVTNYIGEFNFGLSSNGELIMLYDSNSSTIDSLVYDDKLPWPIEPDGNGPTLALKNPLLNNTLPQSWAASAAYGTPGKVNDVYTSLFEENESSLPYKFKLSQNYPNPFNPSTIISIELHKKMHIKLEIYDIIGRKIITLIDREMNGGYHNIDWKPGNEIASGIYFYVIQAGKEIKKTFKMVFIK
jgi:hypothetical protein